MLLLFLLFPVLTRAQDVLNEIYSSENSAWYNASFKQLEDSVMFYQNAAKLPQIPLERKLSIDKYQARLQVFRDSMRHFVALHKLDDKGAKALLIDCFRQTDVTLDTLASMAAMLTGEGLQNTYAAYLFKEIEGRQNNEVGKVFIPFSMPDASGKVVSSHDYAGKYKLVLFWASWCVPCRAEIPGLLRTYHQLKNNGLEVLAVSVDEKKANWLKAIAHDKTDWVNLFDGNAWNTIVARNYAIHLIPQNLLIDPSGKIIAKNISASGLIKLLGKYH